MTNKKIFFYAYFWLRSMSRTEVDLFQVNYSERTRVFNSNIVDHSQRVITL